MDLLVDYQMKVKDLVRKFNEIYPYLRLEIFAKGEEISNAAHDCSLSEITKKKLPVNFKLSPELKVSEVEELFWKSMGLQVSVLRKSGTTWLEASYSNYWSLDRQNTLGREMGNFLTSEIKKI
jgi:hypothetical protein